MDAVAEVSQTLEHFSESVEVTNLLDALPAAACTDIIAQESLCEKFTGAMCLSVCRIVCPRIFVFAVILDRYQEQPHLLDPHLRKRQQ